MNKIFEWLVGFLLEGNFTPYSLSIKFFFTFFWKILQSWKNFVLKSAFLMKNEYINPSKVTSVKQLVKNPLFTTYKWSSQPFCPLIQSNPMIQSQLYQSLTVYPLECHSPCNFHVWLSSSVPVRKHFSRKSDKLILDLFSKMWRKQMNPSYKTFQSEISMRFVCRFQLWQLRRKDILTNSYV